MRYFLLGCLGFISILLSRSLFGSFSFLATASIYAFVLFVLFFYNQKLSSGYWLLGGITLGQELLGVSHPGVAASVSLVLLGLHVLFGQQLRFTSRLARFIVALLILFLTYNLLLVSGRHFFSHLLPLMLLYIVSSLLATLFATLKYAPDHEFV